MLLHFVCYRILSYTIAAMTGVVLPGFHEYVLSRASEGMRGRISMQQTSFVESDLLDTI